MKHKKVLTIPGAVVVSTLAFAGLAFGHNATASGTCQSGVTWTVWNYDKTVTNAITVTIDGVIVHQDLDFKSSDEGTIATDKTVAHTWDVKVDAPGTQWDKHPSGSYAACEAVPTTTVGPTTSMPITTTSMPITDTTTSVVAVGEPPVPSTTLTDVATLTPEPALPATGSSDTVLIGACIIFAAGVVLLVVRGRRVP